MNWKNIKTSTDNTHFLLEGKQIFGKQFTEVLKFHDPGLAPVLDQSGAYHINCYGNQLYSERYDRTFGFYCERAAVTTRNEWFHIDIQGKRISDIAFGWTGNFQEDICTVRAMDGQYFHIDLWDKPRYEAKYVYAGDFKDGIACVKLQNGLFTHIDINGNFIHNKTFVDLGVFHKNFATARDGNGWFHIDKTGNALYNERYALAEPFYNGQALVTLFDYTKILINENGNKLISL